MKTFGFILLVFLLLHQSAIACPDFGKYFTGKTMRVDVYMTGNSRETHYSVDQIYQEGNWPGNPKKLRDPFNNGSYYLKVYSLIDNQLIFSRGFNCIFEEYQTTRPAKNGQKRTFLKPLRFPYPKNPVNVVLERRDENNILHPVFSRIIYPGNKNIVRVQPHKDDRIYEALINGDPSNKVDLVFIAEGYKEKEWEKFREDVDHFKDVLFRVEPYKQNKDWFNIYGAFRPSSDSGVDRPDKGKFVNSVVSASFNALNLPRYLLVDDQKALHDIASIVPYDAIIVIANTDRYGGGGIYNSYSIFSADNERSEALFMHEFGHGFAGLADEYFSSTVSYENYYPDGVEPTEPNITALLDTNHIKWEENLTPGIPVPTPWGQDTIIALQKEQQSNKEKMNRLMKQLGKKSASEKKIAQVKQKYAEKNEVINKKISAIRKKYRKKYEGMIGVFEGAGYQAKGLYRSELGVHMFDMENFTYGTVSEHAIMKIIRHYINVNK
jgi:hypothetical protein